MTTIDLGTYIRIHVFIICPPCGYNSRAVINTRFLEDSMVPTLFGAATYPPNWICSRCASRGSTLFYDFVVRHPDKIIECHELLFSA